MRLTCVILLAVALLGCGGARHETPPPTDDTELTWAYMAPLDSTEALPAFRDAGGLWWSAGMPLTSERVDGSNALVFARLDSFGQFMPVCPPCPCEEE